MRVLLYLDVNQRELKMKRETELIPERDGERWLRQPLQSVQVIGSVKRPCNVLFHVNNLYLLRMIPNLMLRFGFKYLEHCSTDKPKSCNGSVKKKKTD